MADTARLIVAPTTGITPPPPALTAPPPRRPSARPPVRPSLLASLARLLATLLGLGHARAGQLTAQDKRVIAYLVIGLLVASGATIDLDAPPAIAAPAALPSAAATGGAPSAAPAGGGMVDDPTSKGRITATTAHGLAAIRGEFGPVLRWASCWDEHAWNPSSDHPKGRACDVWTSPAGKFAAGAGLAQGNRLVAWLRQHAGPLQVSYVIWQCRIWSPEKGDRVYDGGGIYSCDDPTGGHWDHIHVSYRR